MEKFNVEFVAHEIAIESRGVSVSLDIAKLPHDIIRQVVIHGIKQKVSDAASAVAMTCYVSEKGKDAPKPSRDQLAAFVDSHKDLIESETIASMQKAADALLAGKWMIREGSGTSTKWTEEQSLALDMAKTTLRDLFTSVATKAGVKATGDNFVKLSPKIAAFFNTTGKRPVWNDTSVMEWIGKQAAEGKADYMTQAREELARRADMADQADISDLLGDL